MPIDDLWATGAACDHLLICLLLLHRSEIECGPVPAGYAGILGGLAGGISRKRVPRALLPQSIALASHVPTGLDKVTRRRRSHCLPMRRLIPQPSQIIQDRNPTRGQADPFRRRVQLSQEGMSLAPVSGLGHCVLPLKSLVVGEPAQTVLSGGLSAGR